MDVIKAGNGFALPDDMSDSIRWRSTKSIPSSYWNMENAGHQFMPVPG
jgi:hypothetical protein